MSWRGCACRRGQGGGGLGVAWVVGGRVLSVWVCRSRCVEGIGHGDGCRRLLGVCAFGGRNVCGVCV